MPSYPEEAIEEVRARSDIVDVVSSYVQLKRRGTKYFGLCPFHGEKTPSFCVTPDRQMYYCFGCHKGGNAITFLMDMNNCSFPEAVEELADRCGYKLPKSEPTYEQKMRQTKKTRLIHIYKDAANYYYTKLYSNDGEMGRSYFKEVRALDTDTMKRFALGYASGGDGLYKFLKDKEYDEETMRDSGLIVFDEKKGPRDYFFRRVIFPIMDERGDPIGLGARVLDDSKPKYLNSRENDVFRKRNTIYALNFARRSRREMYILCEGYMDVIALHKAGFDNAIAALGTAFTIEHANKLKKLRRKVYICFDSDTAGVDAALRAIGILRFLDVDCKVITMGDYKDPDELIRSSGAEAFEARINAAHNSLLFAIDVKRRSYDTNDPEENNKFFRYMAGVIATLKTDIERENYIAVLSERYHVPSDSLRELIRDVASHDRELKSIRDEFYHGLSEENVTRAFESTEHADGFRGTFTIESVAARGDKGLRETEGILLTWLFEEPGLFEAVADYISAEDFGDGIYRDIASDMINSYTSGDTFDPAAIMCKFEDHSAHEEIAKMLHTKIEGLSSDKDREILLRETLIKLKRESLNNLDKSSEGAGKRLRQIKADINRLQTATLI